MSDLVHTEGETLDDKYVKGMAEVEKMRTSMKNGTFQDNYIHASIGTTQTGGEDTFKDFTNDSYMANKSSLSTKSRLQLAEMTMKKLHLQNKRLRKELENVGARPKCVVEAFLGNSFCDSEADISVKPAIAVGNTLSTIRNRRIQTAEGNKSRKHNRQIEQLKSRIQAQKMISSSLNTQLYRKERQETELYSTNVALTEENQKLRRELKASQDENTKLRKDALEGAEKIQKLLMVIEAQTTLQGSDWKHLFDIS